MDKQWDLETVTLKLILIPNRIDLISIKYVIQFNLKAIPNLSV